VSELRLLGIPGSLRLGSYNRGLLVAAQELLRDRATLEIVSLAEIPLYNDDVRALGWPEPVARLRGAAAASDAILFATPEYNFAPSGVLKNAIDWLSRKPDPPLRGIPYASMGASSGAFGTVRAQLVLRQIMLFPEALGYQGSLHVARAAQYFDEAGRLTDDETRKRLAGFLDGFLAYLEQIGACPR